MKVFAFALLFLQLAMVIDFGAAQCVSGWSDIGGQCMQCSSTLPAEATTFAGAQGVCRANGGNLATITDRDQQVFAASCGTDPWIGYTTSPVPAFLDGTPFVNYGVTTTPAVAAVLLQDCFFLDTSATNVFQEDNNAGCPGPLPFVCSRPYDSCYDLEVSGEMSVAYTHNDTSPNGKKWVGTTATYSCSTGYNVSSTTTRTCNSEGSWTGSVPTCVLAPVCSALTEPSDSTISYSTPASGSFYTTGTVATQVCKTGYEKKSSSSSRPCQSPGACTESDIVSEDMKAHV